MDYYLYIPAGDLGQGMHGGCEQTGITQLRCNRHQVLVTQGQLLKLFDSLQKNVKILQERRWQKNDIPRTV